MVDEYLIDELIDAISKARERGRKTSDEILSKDDMLYFEDFAKYISVTPFILFHMVYNHEVIAMFNDTKIRFPKWQVDDSGKPYERIPELLKIFQFDSWSVYRFLLQKHNEVNGITGLELLKSGRWNDIINVTESIFSGNFS